MIAKLFSAFVIALSLVCAANAEQLSCAQETVTFNGNTAGITPIFVYGVAFPVQMNKTADGVTVTALGSTFQMQMVEQYAGHIYFYALSDFSLWLSDSTAFDRRSIFFLNGPTRGSGAVYDRVPNAYRYKCDVLS